MTGHPECVLNRRQRGIAAIIAAFAMAAAGCSRGQTSGQAADDASATPREISIPGEGVFPESITSTADGTLYIGSVGQALIFRVPPGAGSAEVFIPPGTAGIKQVFGVLADEASGTLWACSNLLPAGPPGAGPAGPSALHGFELASGVSSSSHALSAGSMCNDIAVSPDGDVFVTDTNGMRVLRLAKGATALEAWSPDGAFGPPGGVLDGIAVVGGRVIVNTLATSKLFAVEIAGDGKAGAVKELALSAPLSAPDGMRAHGQDGVLVTDGTGKIQHVRISGDAASVTTVKEGLEGPVSVTAVGGTAYVLEGQLGILFGSGEAEKPYRVQSFSLISDRNSRRSE